jgi:hypothetical protein
MGINWTDISVTPIEWAGGIGVIAVVTGPATLEYSVDAGVTWTVAGIDVGVGAAADTSFNFELPRKCLIRLDSGTGKVSKIVN